MLVMYLCRYKDSAKAMKAAGGGKIVEQYLATSSQTLRVYTIISMGFIFGYGRAGRALLREQNGATDELITVLKSTVEAKSQVIMRTEHIILTICSLPPFLLLSRSSLCHFSAVCVCPCL